MSTEDELNARELVIASWLESGYQNLLTFACERMCPATRVNEPNGWSTRVLPRGTMFELRRSRRTIEEPLQDWWICRVCSQHVSEVARMAPDPRVADHRIAHCEAWLTWHRYVIPGRYDDREVLADALVHAFGSFVR